MHAGVTFLTGLACGVAVAVVASLAVSLPSLRLHEDLLAISTFGFQLILFNLFQNWVEVTRGPLGIAGIRPPSLFGWVADSPLKFLLLAASLAAIAYTVVLRLAGSPFGRVLRAIREDEVFAQTLGKNTVAFKVKAFAVSAALAAAAGSLYAHFAGYIDPSSFTVMESVLVISMVIVGGAGSRWGPLIGAAVLVTLPEALRFVGLPAATAANLRQLLYGALLVAMMLARPAGLAGHNADRGGAP
jgi:branched-chain amino acid transport system permease protein